MICRRVIPVAMLVLVWACEDREKQAAYDLGLVRDLEESVTDLQKAIERYDDVATTHRGTKSGERAQIRAAQLRSIESRVGDLAVATGDSIYSIGVDIIASASGYPPAMRGIANHLYQKTRLWGRAAATRKDQAMIERVLKTWSFQDSIWSLYDFRAIPEDRNAKNLLCNQALEVARMLEGLKRYKEALQVVSKGIDYGEGNDELARARVFASFYQFRGGAFDSAIVTAEEALTKEDLSHNLKARANHVIGLGYTYKFQDSDQVEHLEAAIDALNLAIGLDPSMSDVRKLLKQLRKKKASLAS
ncbi:MAG: hypothetical protein CME26_12380 [Gemmatimonadetes bacterium]|nr:hypothetical protein [Gemmatimonadota bacterium]|tara:strand:+ start:825 stop:1733 length:909 start_codon:yes stop_codon:yes gene_type:complete